LPTGGRIAPFTEPRSITRLYTVDAVLTGDWDALRTALRYLTLPALTLGLVIGGIFIRLVRVNMLQTLRSDYVEAARARGVKEWRVVLRHAFKNALVPVATIIGLQFALLLSGAVLTETTFTWPGIGLSLFQYLQDRDYIGVQGLVTFYALFVVAVSLLIDLVAAWVDPRIRYE
ncbi:MAG TPA: ABC transporter permease, partial [Acidimicrobiales bacterium]|nr:ABC transporter permease [Acidimicrobiales bacterium]